MFFNLLTGVWYDKDLEPDATRPTTGVTDAVKLLADFERPWKDILPAMLAKDPAKRPTDLINLPKGLVSDVGAAPRRTTMDVTIKGMPPLQRNAPMHPSLLPVLGLPLAHEMTL